MVLDLCDAGCAQINFVLGIENIHDLDCFDTYAYSNGTFLNFYVPCKIAASHFLCMSVHELPQVHLSLSFNLNLNWKVGCNSVEALIQWELF